MKICWCIDAHISRETKKLKWHSIYCFIIHDGAATMKQIPCKFPLNLNCIIEASILYVQYNRGEWAIILIAFFSLDSPHSLKNHPQLEIKSDTFSYLILIEWIASVAIAFRHPDPKSRMDIFGAFSPQTEAR